MASIANITGIFPGATVSSGDLTLPSGSIVSYIPSSTSSPAGKELVFGLCESLYRAVTGAGLNRVTVNAVSSIPETDVLRRTYTFTVELGLTDVALEDMDVAAE
jgi:hypothetical protein